MAYKVKSPQPIIEGGTGAITMTTAYAPVCAGTTATGALQVASTGLGTSGFVLTSTGSSSLPTFQAIPASIATIDGDTGSATGSTITFDASTLCGSTVSFNASGATVSLDVSDGSSNTLIGFNAGNGSLSGINNTSLGGTTLNGLTSGNSNTAVGFHALQVASSGSSNSGFGSGTLTALTIGASNTALGFYALDQLVTGSYNTSVGDNAGYNYTGAESSNINIGYSTSGTLGESNVLRIGSGTGTGNGQLNSAIINGIATKSTGAASSVMLIDSNNLLGTVAGGAVTLNTGTQSLSLSSDASATTVNIATGGAVKTVTLGSTNTTSSTAIKSGTGNIALNSGLTVDSTGRMTNAVQPAFLANLSAATSNDVTGDGTTYTILPADEKFDQGSNFNTGTGTFTAPITGKYQFNLACMVRNIAAGHTTFQLQIKCTNANYNFSYLSPAATQAAGGFLEMNGSTLANMTAGDTAVFQVTVSGSTKTIGVNGNTMDATNQGFTFVSGYLVC